MKLCFMMQLVFMLKTIEIAVECLKLRQKIPLDKYQFGHATQIIIIFF